MLAFRSTLTERHPGAEIHDKTVYLDAGFSYQRFLEGLELPKVSYDPGTPAEVQVLCGYVELDSGGADSLFPGRRLVSPVPVFPDHPQYDELKAAQDKARQDRPAAASDQN
jgi:hypothetical protein